MYAVFDSLEQFKEKIGPSLAELAEHLRRAEGETVPAPSPAPTAHHAPLPKPPAFHAEPDYIGSHTFVGRESQLADLDDWARAADPTNLLLFEAIGGNGKSQLTWEWVRNRAPAVRADWAGRFWYSFYERGAVMADFCRHALAYMTEQPREAFEKKRTPELARLLLAELHARPWLLVLDGLERVLVHYHRIDAAELADEAANAPTDPVMNRNPCDAIHDEDGDLLRQLAGAKGSKILVTTRLAPRVLVNLSGHGIDGVKRFPLPGLRPADGEKLLRSCGITGDSAAMQDYLTQNCDNHPLVIGVLAGLINNYLPNRGNFDAWAADPSPQGGARLDLAKVDLIQRRNHILTAAIEFLDPKSRELLATLALLSASVDYETLAALSPYSPAESPSKLGETVKNLEQRGLLQYDAGSKRHDLHPVVRGVAAGGLETEIRNRYGQRVVDHFSAVPHDPWEHAKTLEDLAPGLHVVRTLLKLERWQEAARIYRGGLSEALLFNLEDYAEVLAVLQPFFPAGWQDLPRGIDSADASYLSSEAANAFFGSGEPERALDLYGVSLRADLVREAWREAGVRLINLSSSLVRVNRLRQALGVGQLALHLAAAMADDEPLFRSRLQVFALLSRPGLWPAAAEMWKLLDHMGRAWSRAVCRQGDAEYFFAQSQFWQGSLQEEHLATATHLAEKDNNRSILRFLFGLDGEWQVEKGKWAAAEEAFLEAVALARERRLLDHWSEAGLALAKWHLGRLGTAAEARQEAERLAGQRKVAHRFLARLWRELGDGEQAEKHALAAYRRAWADGEPYVHRYELTQATALLRELNVPIPDLPAYDPAGEVPFPWEAEVVAAIERIRAEKAAKKR